MSLGVGARLGPYEILAPLGSGGMGEVWKARDTRLDRIVAIKRLLAEHRDRFEQEARAIAALNHPHICQIHDVGPDYLVLEYVEGSPLRGPLPVEEALRLAIQIAGALEAAHRRGILHRDLKPANIILQGASMVKILDFGLAKVMGEDADVTRTMEGVIVGTAAYMSPEQAEGRPLDARSDIFSFGTVLYEMLSGSRAFPGTTTLHVLNAVLRDDVPAFQTMPALDRIMRRCLQKQPADRFQTMSEVRTALEQSTIKPAESPPSIAVLPFANLSADKENEYFSDGLAEEILNALTRVPGLRVIARTSSFAFRGKDQDIRRIAEALDVGTILEGSVRRAGGRIRITAQLINAADGSHLWSERFDREMTDVFAIQDEISQSIVDTLKVKLTARRAASNQTANLEAYHAYLKGRHHLLKLTPDDLARSRSYLEEAIALDPSYAAAHARLAHTLQVAAFMGWQSPHDVLPLAKAAAIQALALDEHEPDAHFVLAMVAGQLEYDWPEALRQCHLAFACENAPPDVVSVLASLILLPLGRVDEALSVLQRARAADPLSPFPQQHLAAALSARGSYNEAIDQLQRLIGLHEDFWPAHFFLGGAYVANGMIREAIAILEKGFRLMPSYAGIAGLLAGCHVLSGDRLRAERVLATLTADRGPRARGLAIFHAVCAEFDQAAVYFEQAIEEREPTVTELGVLPFFVGFRASAHGRALLRKMRLPQFVDSIYDV